MPVLVGGGSCFGKDVRALIESAKEYNYPTPLLESTITVNERQRKILIGKLQEELKILKGRTVGLMGLSFKPNTDDLRGRSQPHNRQSINQNGRQC